MRRDPWRATFVCRALVTNDDEVHAFIDRHAPDESGIGYVDVNLLEATVLTIAAQLWTRDKRLGELAPRLDKGSRR